MAKEVKKEVKKEAPKKKGLPKLEMPQFGVAALAKALDVDERTARLKLRNAEVPKTGRTYDFKNQAGVDKMAKQLALKKVKSAD